MLDQHRLQQPFVSVVIAAVNPVESIEECLAHLDALPERQQMEIVIMSRHSGPEWDAIARRPDLAYIGGLRDRSIPELRWMGMCVARADWIAVLEDHCMVARNWGTEVTKYLDSPYGAVGGPVENGCSERLLDRVLFLAEYCHCMPPLSSGDAELVPGNNVVYRRSALPLHEPHWANVWEMFLQEDLRRRNFRLYLNGAMLVHHKKQFSLQNALSQRYFYSRSFAAMRRAAMTWPGRCLSSAASAFLPAVFLSRIAAALLSKRRGLSDLLQGLPILGLFVTVWAFGEMAGYIAGGGDSLARVE